MTFVRCSFFTLCFTTCFSAWPAHHAGTSGRPRVVAAQSIPAPAPHPPARRTPTPSPQRSSPGYCPQPHSQHYGLLSAASGHCRSLAAARNARTVHLDAWAQRITARRWIRGCLFSLHSWFSPALQSASRLVRPACGEKLRHQRAGWGSWVGDQGKALGLTVIFGVPVCCCLTDRPPLASALLARVSG